MKSHIWDCCSSLLVMHHLQLAIAHKALSHPHSSVPSHEHLALSSLSEM